MRNVLVTGSSSGIGRAITEYLANNGFRVFAGVRKQEDADELNKKNNINGLILDVTNYKHLKTAYKLLKSAGKLSALINNAGVAIPGSLMEMDAKSLHKQFEVNLFGPLKVIQVFFPLLRENKGKIINIGSLNGFMISPISGGAYTMSKFAMEALTEILKIELQKFDIKVCVVDPGQYRTPIYNKLKVDVQKLLEHSVYYKEEYKQILSELEIPDDIGRDTNTISKLILDILNTENIYTRYLSVNKNEQKSTYSAIITRLLEMNESNIYKWSLAEIHNLVNEINKMLFAQTGISREG
ncbi:MAG: SDR family NAD(P)-dependent oxidoreductase [Candidatus Hermodarchaeota archaeon]